MHKRVSISLKHLDRMTDSTGMIQHAIYSIPRRESGYTTDDNARALRLCARLWTRYPTQRMLNRITKYISFIEHARCPTGGFHNLMSYDRRWLDPIGSDDSVSQAILGLAEVLGSGLPDSLGTVARELIEFALPALAATRSLRAQANVILACSHLLSAGVTAIQPLEEASRRAAHHLLDSFDRHRRPGWQWFEPQMTYANGVLPHALFAAARHWSHAEILTVAQESFDFLDRATTAAGFFWPIGNAGWYSYGQDKAAYDQQPVEASTMGDAALAAFNSQNDERYLDAFRRARGWFRGKNSLRLALAEPQSGACCDGLQESGVNLNQGAESTLAFLWIETRSAGNHHDSTGRYPAGATSVRQ
jgi:hypothetical protein